MVKCKVRDKRSRESLDIAIKKFKNMCEKEGILSDIKKFESYQKPSAAKRQRRFRNINKMNKKLSRQRKRQLSKYGTW